MREQADTNLLSLTAEIVSAHVGHNSVHTTELPKMIVAVHGALAALGQPIEASPVEPDYSPAVTVRKSLANDDFIISMIDGKPYRTLRRHLRRHGLTVEEYRARYSLPASYPTVAKSYSAARSAMAQAIGFGRRAGQSVGTVAASVQAEGEEVAAPIVRKARRGAKKVAAAVEEVVQPAAKRGRKPKA